LNRYPRLRFVLHNQLKYYENVEVQWVPGATPTAYFYSADGTEVNNAELGDKSIEELFELFSSHGFTPARPVITYPSEPTSSASFGGHYYELYNTANFFQDANEFAQGRTHEGLQGALLTVTVPDENAFVVGLLSSNGVDKVWIGGQDESEGEWKWIGGEESGTMFWKGKSEGSAVDNHFVNWRAGEPNDVDDEDCAIMYGGDGKWNDGSCVLEKASLVIEYGNQPLSVPEPEIKTDL